MCFKQAIRAVLRIIALALGIFLSFSASVHAAPPALQCTCTAASTPWARTEKLSKRVGDIVLNCMGGAPTAAGATVPVANIRYHSTRDRHLGLEPTGYPSASAT